MKKENYKRLQLVRISYKFNKKGKLNLNDREILTHSREISHDLAIQTAENQYNQFDKKPIIENKTTPDDFEKVLKQIPKTKKN